jgi:methylmalonyl-CoA/ethylmalonyl-CoA epimerase
MIHGLDHLGIAVSDLESAIALWQQVTGGECIHREVVESQRVEVAVIRVGELRIELLCPTNADSPIAKFLASHGPGIHHLALHGDSAQAELDRVAAAGLRVIDQTARPGAEHSNVGFLHPRSLEGVLLEFVDHSPDSA